MHLDDATFSYGSILSQLCYTKLPSQAASSPLFQVQPDGG